MRLRNLFECRKLMLLATILYELVTELGPYYAHTFLQLEAQPPIEYEGYINNSSNISRK